MYRWWSGQDSYELVLAYHTLGLYLHGGSSVKQQKVDFVRHLVKYLQSDGTSFCNFSVKVRNLSHLLCRLFVM